MEERCKKIVFATLEIKNARERKIKLDNNPIEENQLIPQDGWYEPASPAVRHFTVFC